MINIFNKSEIFDCDCFVADYTQQTKNKKKVIISKKPFTDISYFHLIKKNKNQNIPYLAINLEDYAKFTESKNNCECIFESLSECSKPWVLFLEMKYCLSYNIEKHALEAIHQMDAMLNKLKEMKAFEQNKKRIYFVYSVPDHSNKAPFTSFYTTQDKELELHKRGIIFLGENSIIIATANILKVEQEKI